MNQPRARRYLVLASYARTLLAPLAACWFLIAAPKVQAFGPERISLSVAGYSGIRETIGVSDSRPAARGEAGWDVAISVRLRPEVSLSLENDGTTRHVVLEAPGSAARISESGWSLCPGLELWAQPSAGYRTYCGIGFVYNETRSSLDAFGANTSGPRTTSRGLRIRLGLERRIIRFLSAYSELMGSVTRTRAVLPLSTTLTWPSGAVAFAVGLRFGKLPPNRAELGAREEFLHDSPSRASLETESGH